MQLSHTSPTGITATIAVKTADIIAGTFGITVRVGRNREVRATVDAADCMTVTGSHVDLVLNRGAIDQRDMTADELTASIAAAVWMWRKVAKAARAERVTALLAKAAALRADAEADETDLAKAAKLEAAATA